MSKLKAVSFEKFEKFLFEIGCLLKRQSGSHNIYSKDGLIRPVILPYHGKRTIPPFVIASNLKTLGISREEYLKTIEKL